MKITLNWKSGLVGLVLLVALLGFRLATIGEQKDPDLERTIRMELQNHLSQRTGAQLEKLDPQNTTAVKALVRQADASGIELHSMRVSKPLLGFSSTTEAVIRLEYQLPEGDPVTAYWRMTHSAVGGWRYVRETFPLSYYLNFF